MPRCPGPRPRIASHRVQLQGLRHPRRRRQDDRRRSPSISARAFGTEALQPASGGRGRARRARVRARPGGGADRGLQSTGLDVVDIGAVTTPMLYYVAAHAAEHGCSSGIQVTGSHNPKDYNGFKMVLAGRAIYGDDIQACAGA
jgi:hypothetical protein